MATDENIKSLVIKVKDESIPKGASFKWHDFTASMEVFTRDIITPPIGDGSDSSSVNIGAVVSGMPTAFARANLFKLALDYVDNNELDSGILAYYKMLVSEWRGFIGCMALDYANVRAERIYLKYSDGNSIAETHNIYEPKGAFGNVLFERRDLWCDQNASENAEKTPFIDVITYKDVVIGGTSPDSLLFTSVGYRIPESVDTPIFASKSTRKLIDPMLSNPSQEQLLKLYGYVKHMHDSVNIFDQYYQSLPANVKPRHQNLINNLAKWLEEMEGYALTNNYKLDGASVPPVSIFDKPFSTLFNYSNVLHGVDGTIYEEADESAGTISFDPKDLLLPQTSIIAGVGHSEDTLDGSPFRDKPISLLKATVLGMPHMYFYFAVPLSSKGLNVFGKNIDALVGIDPNSGIKSRLTAIFDPTRETNNLTIKLLLVTTEGRELSQEVVYTAAPDAIQGHDIILWPNFISKQWRRYFMYSELPHNAVSAANTFRATPIVGDMEDSHFPIMMQEETDGKDKNIHPIYLAKNGKCAVPEGQDKLKADLLITSDHRVSDINYKYEIYESNQPYKGVQLMSGDKEGGYIMIRYDVAGRNGLPKNELDTTRELSNVVLGVDFGSTNTSIAYFDGEKTSQIELTNHRVSLFNPSEHDNNTTPAMEDEIFFFQNEQIAGNAIKSMLTIHDTKRFVNKETTVSTDAIFAQPVTGGFPCFEKNLPIEDVTPNRYRLGYTRSGIAEIVYDMKWSKDEVENAHKKAFLSTLLLHIYAQLFEKNKFPKKLKWSYPSSMSTSMVTKYNGIWTSLKEVKPIAPPHNSDVNYDLTICSSRGEVVENNSKPEQSTQSTFDNSSFSPTPSTTVICDNCGTPITGKFCPNCGTPAPVPSTEVHCTQCGTVFKGKFCPNCGTPAPAPSSEVHCTQCGTVFKGKFCPNCGTPAPAGGAVAMIKKCPKCGKEIEGKFCPECGSQAIEVPSTAAPAFTQQQPIHSEPILNDWTKSGFGQDDDNEIDIRIDNGPITFNFTTLDDNSCMTEALAVANYFANNSQVKTTDPNSLTLCFDIGGSTTDISALCQMGKKKPQLCLVKQNSIRFAAQRISKATEYAPNIRSVLLEICRIKGYRVQGLNVEPVKYENKMAPYYYDQMLDRLRPEDAPALYSEISSRCPELMSVNAYVTGLIMYYAGQLAEKLIHELRNCPEGNVAMDNKWRPTVNVVFAGKGSRIFEWLPTIYKEAGEKYYTTQFINGMGGKEIALQLLSDKPKINPTNKDNKGLDVKYEVSKGLTSPVKVMVPHNEDAIEILGEDGFVVFKNGQQIRLPYDNSITPDMMRYLGSMFTHMPLPGMAPCPRFMDFSNLFFKTSSALFGLQMSQKDFENAFDNMMINDYITTMPEYYAAQDLVKQDESNRFDFVAPIIILEGMKFYDDYLIPSLKKQR
ncbi:MAG: hypothetical protein J6Y98_04005 [Bacteroidales bacterium]|nr:hypothetical protein [Bacteroidales bacterium]